MTNDTKPETRPPLPTLETAWLVEWKAHGYGPQWWGFNHEPGKRGSWCADANNAVRFARKEDAERMRLHIIAVAGLTGQHDYERSISATEHEWIDTQARAVPPNGWQWKLMPVDLSPEAAERARKDLMSVERGRKVGDLTREIRRRQMGSGVDTTALDAAPSAVPAGWKLVPVEPTPEMLEASDSHCHDDLLYPQDMLLGPRAMRTTEYRAMLAAAPSPAEVNQQPRE